VEGRWIFNTRLPHYLCRLPMNWRRTSVSRARHRFARFNNNNNNNNNAIIYLYYIYRRTAVNCDCRDNYNGCELWRISRGVCEVGILLLLLLLLNTVAVRGVLRLIRTYTRLQHDSGAQYNDNIPDTIGNDRESRPPLFIMARIRIQYKRRILAKYYARVYKNKISKIFRAKYKTCKNQFNNLYFIIDSNIIIMRR